MEFTKVLLAKNQSGIDSEILQNQTHQNYFQECVNDVLALGVTMQENDLLRFFENPKAYITDKLTAGENMQVGGLKLNKEKLFDLIEKPTGTNELIEKIELDKQKQYFNQFTILTANRFKIIENIVSLNSEFMERIETMYSLYIETENQQNGYNKVIQLVNLINEINEIATYKIGIETDLGEILTTINPNDYSSYKVSHEAIKRFV